jgi:hypothetical protein
MWNVGCRMWDVECRMYDVGCGMWDLTFLIILLSGHFCLPIAGTIRFSLRGQYMGMVD